MNSFRTTIVVAALALCAFVSVADAQCTGLNIAASAAEGSNSDIVVTGTVMDARYNGGAFVMVLGTLVEKVTKPVGVEDVDTSFNQVTMTLTEDNVGAFSMVVTVADPDAASILMVSASGVLCDVSAITTPPMSADWSWQGDNGPANWEKIGYPDCGPGNVFQSPFNIQTATAEKGNLVDEMVHQESDFTVKQSHGMPVFTCASLGACGSITADGTKYDLLQFHLHSYSEYALDGALGIIGVHFVHLSEEGTLLVLGRIFYMSEEENSGFAKFWTPKTISAEEDDNVTVTLDINADMYADAITKGSKLYQFQGSLTTPPCSGNVQWLFLGTPGRINTDQANAYRSHSAFTNQRGENRPLQPVNGREILVSTF